MNTCFKCSGGVFDPDTNDCTCEGAGKIFNAETKRSGCESYFFLVACSSYIIDVDVVDVRPVTAT